MLDAISGNSYRLMLFLLRLCAEIFVKGLAPMQIFWMTALFADGDCSIYLYYILLAVPRLIISEKSIYTKSLTENLFEKRSYLLRRDNLSDPELHRDISPKTALLYYC